MANNGLISALDKIRESEEYLAEFCISQFTEELYRLMDELNVSQKQLAEEVGKSTSYISRVLNGNANLTAKTMSTLAAALDANVHVHLAPKTAYVNWVDVHSSDHQAAGFVYRFTGKPVFKTRNSRVGASSSHSESVSFQV